MKRATKKASNTFQYRQNPTAGNTKFLAEMDISENDHV